MDGVLLVLIFLLVVIAALAAYGLWKYRRLAVILKFLFLSCMIVAGEEDPFGDAVSIEDQPMIFPTQMDAAASLIERAICPSCGADEEAWRASALAWLNNSSWGNATA
jgi:hypothetical protein